MGKTIDLVKVLGTTPQPLYNTIVGVHCINHVSGHDHLWSFFYIIYTF